MSMTPGTGRDREASQALATWWLARGEDQLPAAGDWLSAAERSRADALRYAKRRTDFLLGRWTLKLAVARVLGWPDDPAVLAGSRAGTRRAAPPGSTSTASRRAAACRSATGRGVPSAW